MVPSKDLSRAAAPSSANTQFIPMAFVHSGRQALLTAVLIGLLGGLANAACIDIAIRACPPGLQGTLMMMIAACFALSSRGGDVLGRGSMA
jgi:hypothetical protein